MTPLPRSAYLPPDGNPWELGTVRPLEGMRVIALEHAVAAPICSRHLADLGADVIKIERPNDGDFARAYDGFVHGMSCYFVWLNRAKRSVTLDLKHAEAKQVLARLLEGADVLLQNLAPGAASRLGLSYKVLKQRHPKLVVCDISGYGESGPMAQKKAYDLLIQAESGLISVTGSPQTPSRVGISAADIATGMYALTGILSALLRRSRTGEGTNVKIAMLDALGEWMTAPVYRAAYANSPQPRDPGGHPLLVPYGKHRTMDGEVIFGLQNEREWKVFCDKVLHRPEVASDPRFSTMSARREHREELTSLIEDHFAQMTSMEVVAVLDQAGIANGRLNQSIDVWHHVQFAARDKWREVDTPNGPIRALLPPFTFADEEAVMGDVPALGQHTEEVLRELGYGQTEITAMHSAGAV